MDRPVARTILVIDDDPLMRALIRDTLQAEGWTTLEAPDGTAGIARARHGSPDLILLDVLMPGLDGYATCEQLKAAPATKPIPVLFVTSTPDRDLNRRAYRLGAVACIPKPFRRGALLAMVRMALAHRTRHGPPALAQGGAVAGAPTGSLGREAVRPTPASGRRCEWARPR